MTHRRLTALIALAATFAGPVAALQAVATPQAADTAAYSRSMTIERDFAPIIQQATKMDRLPAVDAPTPLPPAAVTYASWQARPMTTSQTGTLPVGQVFVQPDPAPRGWLDAYLGSYLNSRIDAGFRHRGFTIDGRLRFSRGTLPLGHKESQIPALGATAAPADGSTPVHQDVVPSYEWESKFASARLRAGYEHTFSNSARLRIHAGAEGSKYNLFDWALAAPEAPQSPLAWLPMDTRATQRVGTLFATADFDLHRWHLDLAYRRTGIDQPATSADDVASGTLALRAAWFGRPTERHRQWGGDLLIGGSHGDWKGVTAKYVAHYSALPASGAFRRFYADAGIGFDHTPLDRLLDQFPFALIPSHADYARLGIPSIKHDKAELGSQFDLIDLRVGYEDNEQGYLRWNVYAKMRYTMNALIRYALYADGTAEPQPTHGTRTVFDRDDDLALGLGLALDYEYSRHFGLTLAADYTHHTEKLAATDVPAFTLEGHALVRPSRSLTFDLSFRGGLQRTGYYRVMSSSVPDETAVDPGWSVRDIDLDPILDLGLRIDYRFSPRLAVYAFGTNLMNRKTDRWTLVPAQGIALHAGFSWRF